MRVGQHTREKPLRTARPFTIYVLAWTIVGLISFALGVARRVYLGDPYPWQEAGFWTVRIALSVALTPVLLWLERRWPLDRARWLPIIALHLLFSVVFSLARVVLETLIHSNFLATGFLPRYASFDDTLVIMLILGFHSGVVAYWVVFAIQSAIRYYGQMQARALQASQFAAQVAEARLAALKAQLQPHFLFNTLNAIVVLVRQQQWRLAEETLARLSDLLRALLQDIEAQEVPLSRELEYARLYLSIEQLRFSDRLRYAIAADEDTLDAMVPHMVLQPLVENAAKHGVATRVAAGFIEVAARRCGDTLQLTVSDNGPGFGAPPASAGAGAGAGAGLGIGLANTRSRLRQLYGEAAELSTGAAVSGGALVRVVVPFRLQRLSQS